MSEKRYKRIHDNTSKFIVFDKQEGIKGNIDKLSFEADEIIDLLNKQDQQIKQLKKEIKSKDEIIKIYYEIMDNE